MKLPQLKALVQRGESNSLEFKESTKQLDRGMETLCAFLNSKDGGTLLFGVTDKKGTIVGQSDKDKGRQLIANHLNRIEPLPDVETLFIPIDKEKSGIALIARPGHHGPYVCNGKPYVRIQSTTKVMPQEKYKRLLSAQLSKTAWEDSTNNHCTIADLDKNRIKQVVRIAIDEKRIPEAEANANIDAILRKFNLIIDNKLTNGAVILFCKNEEKQFAQSFY